MISSTDLFNFLKIPSGGNDLKTRLHADLAEFKRGKKELGRSLPIKIRDDGIEFSISELEIQNLCGWYLQNQIDEVELEYFSNLIEFSEDIVYSEEIEQKIFSLATPDVDGELNPNTVRKILSRLN